MTITQLVTSQMSSYLPGQVAHSAATAIRLGHYHQLGIKPAKETSSKLTWGRPPVACFSPYRVESTYDAPPLDGTQIARL